MCWLIFFKGGLRLWVQDLGFGVQGLRFWSLGFRIWSLGFRISGVVGFRVQGSGSRAFDSGSVTFGKSHLNRASSQPLGMLDIQFVDPEITCTCLVVELPPWGSSTLSAFFAGRS